MPPLIDNLQQRKKLFYEKIDHRWRKCSLVKSVNISCIFNVLVKNEAELFLDGDIEEQVVTVQARHIQVSALTNIE